jgi:hypothetical protein
MNQLAQLALKYGSDKHGHHDYCTHYERHLGYFRDKHITLLELGVGGYEYPDRGGAGMKMFNDYLPNAKVIGVDVHPKKGLDNGRMKFFQGSQADEDFLHRLIKKEGAPTIIIDDASHMNSLTRRSFEILFPRLQPGGVYVIEDIESSWWEDHGFDGVADPFHEDFKTTINMLKSLTVAANRRYIKLPEGYVLAPIESIHFYSNICFIHKSKKP